MNATRGRGRTGGRPYTPPARLERGLTPPRSSALTRERAPSESPELSCADDLDGAVQIMDRHSNPTGGKSTWSSCNAVDGGSKTNVSAGCKPRWTRFRNALKALTGSGDDLEATREALGLPLGALLARCEGGWRRGSRTRKGGPEPALILWDEPLLTEGPHLVPC